MTREKALMEVLRKKDKEDKIHYSVAYNIINEIFDSFENRTCKNCKWFDGKMYCLNEENDTYNSISDFRYLRKVSKNSTCEKFEKK